MKLENKIAHLLTEYDRRQAKKKHYNPFALGIYLEAGERVWMQHKEGIPLHRCLLRNFNDRLLDFMICGLSAELEEERKGAE